MWAKFFKDEIKKVAYRPDDTPPQIIEDRERMEGYVDGSNLWEQDLTRSITKLIQSGDLNKERLKGLKDALNEKQRTA